MTNESHSKGSRRVTSNGTTQHQHKCTRDCHQGLSPEIVTRDGHQIQSPDRPDTNTFIALFGWVTNLGASKFQTLTWVFQASAVQCYLTEPQITGTQSKWRSVSWKLWPASSHCLLSWRVCVLSIWISVQWKYKHQKCRRLSKDCHSTFSVFSLWWCHPVGNWVSLFGTFCLWCLNLDFSFADVALWTNIFWGGWVFLPFFCFNKWCHPVRNWVSLFLLFLPFAV